MAGLKIGKKPKFKTSDSAVSQTTGEAKEKRSSSRRRQTACFELSSRYVNRRCYSEVALLDSMGRDITYKDGHSYHFITGGDIDSLSFLKSVLRFQDLDYVLLTTWCMAAEDILQIEEWIQEGRIKKIDFYMGEIFPNQYRVENGMIDNIIEKYKCGRKCVFKNHAKIFSGYGDKFYFSIESSANINTNPRCENTVVTISKELYEFHRKYFDGVVTFEKDKRDDQKQKGYNGSKFRENDETLLKKDSGN